MKDETKNLDFEIIKEVWNEYELEEGTIIKGRAILYSVDFIAGEEKIGYETEAKKVFGVICPKKFYGDPSERDYDNS